jgi:hypothetical protein
MGGSAEHEHLEKVWRDCIVASKSNLNRITYRDFKRLMKGQGKEENTSSFNASSGILASGSGFMEQSLEMITEGVISAQESSEDLIMNGDGSDVLVKADKRIVYEKARSRSYEAKASMWDHSNDRNQIKEQCPPLLVRDASRAVILPGQGDKTHDEVIKNKGISALFVNRALYRKHREMRIAVLEASKQFDKKRNDIQTSAHHVPTKAGLIMKRGARPPVELEDAHRRALFDAAAKRCGRTEGERKQRTKTVSDVSGMLGETNK